MRRDRFVAGVLLRMSEQPDALGADREQLLGRASEMSPMAFVLLLAKGVGQDRGTTASEGSEPAALEALIDRLAQRNGFTAEDAKEAITFLRDGTLDKDLASVLAETSRVLGRMPQSVASSLRQAVANPLRVFHVAFAVAQDLAELPSEGAGISEREFVRLMQGGAAGPSREFPLFDHTFEALYDIEPIEVLTGWMIEVTGRPSVQLALIVYARTHGVELSRDDIEAARASLREGNLTPAVVRGIEYFRDKHAGRFF